MENYNKHNDIILNLIEQVSLLRAEVMELHKGIDLMRKQRIDNDDDIVLHTEIITSVEELISQKLIPSCRFKWVEKLFFKN